MRILSSFYTKSVPFFRCFAIIVFILGTMFCVENLFGQEPKFPIDLEKKNLIAKQWLEPAHITSNQEKYDVYYYDLLYDFNVESNIGNPIAMIEIRLTVTDGPISVVELNFNHFRTVDSTKVNMITTGFTHEDNILTVDLDRSYSNEENVSIIVHYHAPSFTLGSDYDGKPMFFSLFEPYGARSAFPCKDIPSDKADSVDIKFRVPDPMIAVSNGLLVSAISENEHTTYWWKSTYPIATYLIFIAAYDYLHYQDWYVSVNGDSMPIDFYVIPDHYENSQENFYETKNMISIFADLFGEYPFIEERYGHAEIASGVSMEHQTCTSLGIFSGGNGVYSLDLIAHELAHHWWGDMITCHSFHHIWLNEGFATYSEALYFEAIGGSDAYHANMRGNEFYGAGNIYVDDPWNEDIFDWGLSYRKGAYVLHMLRHVVGDSNFFLILRTYADDVRYQYKSATTADFQAICKDISGMKFEKYFQQWIYGERYPQYAYGWNLKEDEGGYYIILGIEQIQEDAGLFWMPIDVEITTANYDTTFVVWDSLQNQTFEFFLDEEPLAITLDPNRWILKITEEILLTPRADSIVINSAYQKPGIDTLLIRCQTVNPDNYDLQLEAIIASIDGDITESVLMYDDGLNHDDSAGDSLFGAVWPVPAGERSYTIHIKTQNLDTEYYNTLMDASYFTTTGPLVLDKVEIASEDTVANPGDFIGFQFTLRNLGKTDTVYNISSKIVSVDDCASMASFSDPGYGNIPPGESSVADRVTRIRFDEECMAPAHMLFYLDLYADDQLIWQDSFSVDLITDIAENRSSLPREFALKQNHPNPFNPVTMINYQLSMTNDVELSIYNVTGQKVATLVQETQRAGSHQVEWDASGFASGIYYYRLEAGEFVDVKKMVLIR